MLHLRSNQFPSNLVSRQFFLFCWMFWTDPAAGLYTSSKWRNHYIHLLMIEVKPLPVSKKVSKVNRWINIALYYKPFITKALRYGPTVWKVCMEGSGEQYSWPSNCKFTENHSSDQLLISNKYNIGQLCLQ